MNEGQSPLTITAVTLSGPSVFEARLPPPLSTGQPLSLDGEATEVIEVSFTPTTAGVFEATLTIESNATNGAKKVIEVSARSAPPSM